MDFLPEKIAVAALHGAGKGHSFAADVFTTRPHFDEIQSFQPIVEGLREKVAISIARKSCQLASIDLLMDRGGLLAIFTFKAEIATSPAKTAVDTVLNAFPAEQRKAVQDTLRPLDYLDKLRFGAMETVASLRPFIAEEEEEEDVPIEISTPCVHTQGLQKEHVPPEFRTRKTRAQLIEKGEAPYRNALDGKTLAIGDLGAPCVEPLSVRFAMECWIETAQTRATIVILSVGVRSLSYIHSTHEARRQLLLKSRLPPSPSLVDVVAASFALVEEGALPAPASSRVHKSEFLKRCGVALAAVNPTAERDQKKLTPLEKRALAILMGAEPSCDLCPGKAAHHYEWNALGCCWTKNEQLPAQGPERNICSKCRAACDDYACNVCRSSEFLSGIKLSSVWLRASRGAIHQHSLTCRCGGHATTCAGPVIPVKDTLRKQVRWLRWKRQRAELTDFQLEKQQKADDAAEDDMLLEMRHDAKARC